MVIMRKAVNGDFMICPRHESCGFFKKYKAIKGAKWYGQLVGSYCKGPLQPLCKRLKYVIERGSEPSPDLRPDGYQAGTNEKVYT